MTRFGAVLLAAGSGSRFGTNKLLAPFGGRPLIARAMDRLAELSLERVAVVTAYPQVAQLARTYGFEPVHNVHPEYGQSHSIVLGVQALGDMDALLLLAGDQPLLTGDSLSRLVRAYAQSGRGIACLQDGTHMGNPALFDRAYFPALCALEGDRGAKSILRANESDLLVVACGREDELSDCDDPQALRVLIEKV